MYVAYTDTTDVTYTDTDVEAGVLYVYSVTALDFLARIHRRTPMDGVRTAEGGG